MDELQQRADHSFGGRLEQAFVDWYIDAEFGQVKWKFTDDSNDAGVDAVVWLPEEDPGVVLIQSKFTKKVSSGKLKDGAYSDFADVAHAYRYRGEAFEELLSRARADLRPIYRKAFDVLQKSDNWFQRKKAFRLITTHVRNGKAECDGLSAEAFVYSDDVFRLYEQYRQCLTPRARPLLLHVDDRLAYKDARRSVKSYIFNAKVCDFRRYFDVNDVARLVARNIRYDLGSGIGRNIKATYEDVPHDFWYRHNGITIICDDMSESNGTAKLVNPSVINGAQTLYAIRPSSVKNSSALVTCKVIVRGKSSKAIEDDGWVQDIIRGVNTQNKVRESDLRSNEPEQILLQTRLREFKVYYERKRGEWREVRNEPRFRSFERLPLGTLGQILTAVSEKDGSGVLVAKQGVDVVFKNPHYRKLFPDRAKVSRRFERIYLAYRTYRLLEKRGYKNSATLRVQRHAFWPCLWLLHQGISERISHTKTTPQSLRKAFDDLEASGGFASMGRKALKLVTRYVWETFKAAQKKDPELTPNNFFKTQKGIRALEARAYPKLRAALHQLGTAIEEH